MLAELTWPFRPKLDDVVALIHPSGSYPLVNIGLIAYICPLKLRSEVAASKLLTHLSMLLRVTLAPNGQPEDKEE